MSYNRAVDFSDNGTDNVTADLASDDGAAVRSVPGAERLGARLGLRAAPPRGQVLGRLVQRHVWRLRVLVPKVLPQRRHVLLRRLHVQEARGGRWRKAL